MKKKNKFIAGETVKVISGKFFGRIIKISKVDRKKRIAYSEEIFREKFVKKNSSDEKEQRIVSEKEKRMIPFDISNLKKEVEVK